MRILSLACALVFWNMHCQHGAAQAQTLDRCDPVIASPVNSLNSVLIHSLRSGDLPIQSVAISDDGRRIAAGGNDRRVRVWERVSGRLLMESAVLGGPLWQVRFTKNSQRIIGWGPEGRDINTRIWDIFNGSILGIRKTVIEVPTAASAFVIELITVNADRIGVFDFLQAQPLFTWERAPYELSAALAIGPNGPVVLSALKEARFIDRTGERSLYPVPEFGKTLADSAMSPDGKTAFHQGAVWDVASGKQLYVIPNDPTGWGIHKARFSVDGQTLFLTYFYHIVAFEARSGRKISSMCGLTNSPPHATPSGDGQLIIAPTADRGVGVWNVLTGSLAAKIAPSQGEIWSVDLSHDGANLVLGTDSGVIQVWKLFKSKLQ